MLYPALIPAPQKGCNARTYLAYTGQARKWMDIKASVRHQHDACEHCGRDWALELHEIWFYDRPTATQRLMRLQMLCPSCHDVVHYHRYQVAGDQDRVDFCRWKLQATNGWDDATAAAILAKAETEHQRNAALNFRLDLSLLGKFGIAVDDVFDCHTPEFQAWLAANTPGKPTPERAVQLGIS